MPAFVPATTRLRRRSNMHVTARFRDLQRERRHKGSLEKNNGAKLLNSTTELSLVYENELFWWPCFRFIDCIVPYFMAKSFEGSSKDGFIEETTPLFSWGAVEIHEEPHVGIAQSTALRLHNCTWIITKNWFITKIVPQCHSRTKFQSRNRVQGLHRINSACSGSSKVWPTSHCISEPGLVLMNCWLNELPRGWSTAHFGRHSPWKRLIPTVYSCILWVLFEVEFLQAISCRSFWGV